MAGFLAALLAGPLLLAPRPLAPDVPLDEAAHRGWIWPTTPEHLAIAAVLRESRQAEASATGRLAQRIADSGKGAAEAGIDILFRGRVPEVGQGDRPQVLSEPQRSLLLDALARLPEADVRAGLATRLGSDPPDAGSRVAAVDLLGAIGNAGDLARIVDLAPRGPGDEKVLLREARRAVRSSFTAILRRDPGAWPALAQIVGRIDADAGRPALEAVGSGRDPRALEVLYRAARSLPALRIQATTLVAVCGRSARASVDREFAAWMASELPLARTEYARALLQGLGVLDDGSHVAAMIERLEDLHAGVRDAAWTALKRESGLGFPADVQPWLAWHREEVAWHANRRPRLGDDLVSNDALRIVAALRAYSGHRTRRAELARDVARVLVHARPDLRLLACQVLGSLGDPCATADLAKSLLDPDPAVSEAAWMALKSITGLELPRDALQVRELLAIP